MASYDCTARLWSVATGECLQKFIGHMSIVFSAVFSSDSDSVLTASCDDMAKLWSVTTGECLQTFAGHMSIVISAVVFPRTALRY